MSIPKCISANSGTIRLVVRAKPGAKKSNIVSLDEEAIGVQIAAPAREGAANTELISFMSHVLGVKPRAVTLDVGSKSRNKTLLVSIDKTAEDVHRMLKDSIDN